MFATLLRVHGVFTYLSRFPHKSTWALYYTSIACRVDYLLSKCVLGSIWWTAHMLYQVFYVAGCWCVFRLKDVVHVSCNWRVKSTIILPFVIPYMVYKGTAAQMKVMRLCVSVCFCGKLAEVRTAVQYGWHTALVTSTMMPTEIFAIARLYKYTIYIYLMVCQLLPHNCARAPVKTQHSTEAHHFLCVFDGGGCCVETKMLTTRKIRHNLPLLRWTWPCLR